MYNRRQGKAKGPAAARSRGGTMDVDPLLCEEPGLLNSLDPLFSLQGHLLQFFHISSLPKWYTRYSHQQGGVLNPELYKVQQIQFTARKLIGQFKLSSLGKTEL